MMDKKQKVLIVHNYYQFPGGEDTVVANEQKLLGDHGHKFILYSRNNSELKAMSILNKLLLPFTTIYNPKTSKDVKRIIREEHIDIVHVHNTLNLISPSVYYAARACNVPVVQTIHNFRLLCPGATFYRDGHICEDCVEHGLGCAVKHSCYRGSKLQTLACVISTKIHRMTGIYGKINYICLTEFNKEKLLELNNAVGKELIREDRVFVKPNFVESSDEIVASKKRADQFIYVGRLDKLKGIDILLKAWKLMDATFKLIVCGTGPIEDWCKQFVSENKVNVEMKGFVPNAEARRLISNSKALILPTQWYEGFPMTIVEAYSVGTPVICTNFGNAGSVVIDGVTGWKFKDTCGLIDRIKRAMQDDSISDFVEKMYREKYTAEVNYEKLRDIYRRSY